MNLLTSAEARQMAENLWGRGGTSPKRTNTRGAFYFSCSSHGGFIIDARALTPEQVADLKLYRKPDTVTRYSTSYGKVLGMMTPYRSKSIRIPFDYKAEVFEVFVLEEDCDWALAYRFTTVRLNDDAKQGPEREQEVAVCAAKTFWDWFDKTNPVVQARDRADKARAEQHPGLIISAAQAGDGRVKVWTADGEQHLVTGYDRAQDEGGAPWLYLCETVEHI